MIKILFFLVSFNLFAQKPSLYPYHPRHSLENFVKIKLGEDLQYGTGAVVGADENFFYLITALHCCKSEDENMDDSVQLFAVFGHPEEEKLLQFPAKIVATNISLDLAVLSVKRSYFSEVKNLELNDFFLYEYYNLTTIDNYQSTKLNYNSFRGGSMISFDYIKQDLINVNLNDDKKFFGMTYIGVAPGHSGSMVRNTQYEVVGMLLQLNENRTVAKVLKISEILNFLNASQISTTYFAPSFYNGIWRPMSIVFPDGYKHVFDDDDIVEIRDNKFHGAVEGMLAVGDSINIFHLNHFTENNGPGRFNGIRYLSSKGVSIDQWPNPELSDLEPPKQNPDFLRIHNSDFTFYLKKR